MANYDQRMDYGVSNLTSIKENASFNGFGLADSGFDTFDLSASPIQSNDLDHYPTSVNGHANHSTELFDPLKPVQENGDPPNLLDMDFFDPLEPLPEEFPSPENTSSPNLMEEQLIEFGERDSSPNASLTASPVDFFSRTVDPDASLGAGRISSNESEDGGSMSEGPVMPTGSSSKERDSGAECDSIDDEVQQQESPNLLPTIIYQREVEVEVVVDNEYEHDDHLHDAVILDTGYKNKLNTKKGKKKDLDPPTVTTHLDIKVKRSKTEVKMRIPEAEKENVNVVLKKIPLTQKEKENISVTQKQVSVVQKEKNEVSPSPVSQDLLDNILDGDHEQFLETEYNESISEDMKENIDTRVSVNHLKSSFTNGFDPTDEDINNEKEVIITGVDIRTLRENYWQNAHLDDADKNKEKIETGISIKDLKSSYVAVSRFQDVAINQRARSVGDLRGSRISEIPLGVSVEALRASYCDLIKLDDTKVRMRENINTGVSIKSLKTSFISNETPNNESPGVKIDSAKIKRSFSQEDYPLYALLDAYDGVLSRDEQSNLCRICGRPVFLMDRIKAEKSVFHRTCFRCKECNKQLTVDSYCSHETVLYCKLHFKQLFQPKVNFVEEPRLAHRKNEDVIKENVPMELPPDVIRSSDKLDYGLEEIPSLKNIRGRFENPEDEIDGDLDKGVGQVSVKRSESILSKMAKFQVGETENGHYEDYESDDNETTDPDVIKETRKKEKLYGSQEEDEDMTFSGMNDLKTQWEMGPERAWDEERARETKEELNQLRQSQSKANVKAAYENAIQEGERSPAKETSMSSENREIKSIAEKWERGEVLNESEQEKLDYFNKEKEEDLSVFRDSGLNEARNLFKKIDETVSKSGTAVAFNKSPSLERNNSSRRIVRDQVIPSDAEIIRSTNHKEEIVVDSTKLHEKFRFFENYQDPPQQVERKRFAMTPPRDPQPQQDESDNEIERDPNVVRSSDREQEIVTDTASKMLNKFRELEIQRGDDYVPQGPKPLKRITPPREFTAVYDDDRGNSPEPDRDPNVIRCSDKIEDVALIEAEKTRNLRAKFENWANEDDEEVEDDYSKSYEYDDGQPSIDTTKNLKAKFEALREESERANTKPKSPKVNRFVEQQYDQCSICSERLYPMEKMEANNLRFHKSCFKCRLCSNPLRLENSCFNDGAFYCNPHYRQLFLARGNYDEGFGRDQPKEKWNRSRSSTPNRSRSNTPTAIGACDYEATEEISA